MGTIIVKTGELEYFIEFLLEICRHGTDSYFVGVELCKGLNTQHFVGIGCVRALAVRRYMVDGW